MTYYGSTDWRKYQDFLIPLGVVVVFLLVVAFLGQFINSLPFWVQFLGVGVPVTIVIMHFFGKQAGNGLKLLIALLLVNFSWDLIMPPYIVDLQGNINTTVYLGGTSTDYFLGSIFQSLGINGFLLFFFTYFIGFALLFGSSLLLVKSARRK